MRAIDASEHSAREAGIDFAALAELVRAAMASGVAYALEEYRAGRVDLAAPLGDAFGDYPAEFLRIRSALVEALAVSGEAE